MDVSIWHLILIWLPAIWSILCNIHKVLKEIRDILKKGGE